MAHQFPAKAVAKTLYGVYRNSGKPVMASANLRSLFGAIRNQGQLGSCSAFASTNFRSGLLVQAGNPYQDFSALANYYQERVINGTVSTDSGATMQEAIQVLEQSGVMPDADWNYANYLADWKLSPPSDWIAALRLNPSNVYEIQQATVLADTLDALSNGDPVVFGFVVFPDLESAQVADNGLLPMPIIPTGQSPFFGNIGGHMVVAIGYDQATSQILCLNQWGAGWGIKSPSDLMGCFWMPYAYYQTYAFNPMVYPQSASAVAHKYTLSVSFAASSEPAGKANTFTVRAQDSSSPMANQPIKVTSIIGGGTHAQTLTTGSNGVVEISVISRMAGSVIASAQWIDPGGVAHVESATAKWVDVNPAPNPAHIRYEVITGWFDGDAQGCPAADSAAAKIKKLGWNSWVQKV